ncbi:MAG TPA: NADH-quinone oxidoreductase subunit N, partial [Candidatus Saccharimonadales bacterium]|nr:NADH-quinone oxidoreductase subunit N [Candidatus Saccharimonadales bacterium]
LWTPPHSKARLNYAAVIGLLIILAISFWAPAGGAASVDSLLVQDGLALFFQRFFLVSAIFVLLMAGEFSARIPMGIGEFYVIVLMALAGMMLAASVNDFVLLFVALELISISFYVLVSFQRSRISSLEAGVKYLILSALASSFLIFGIALIFGTSNQTNFVRIQAENPALLSDKVFWLGALLVMVGLGFKIAAVPLQVWAPDVYQGAPTPATAFLAIGSKAAGFVLLLRVLFVALPGLIVHWDKLLMLAAAFTILYGNLCAIPQRNLKRLLGYSSISNAGYLLLGIAALNASGAAAILYYLAGYLFTVAAAFVVIIVVARENEDIGSLAGLSQRSPFLAASMTLAMVSLAGIPPLAGFMGKFFLLRAVIEHAAANPAYYCLALVAIVGVVISLYYYFGVIRAMYWAKDPTDLSSITVSLPMKLCLFVCIAGMLYLGIFPDCVWSSATEAVKALKF